MTTYKKGDRVVIIDTQHGHELEIGETVEIIEVDGEDSYAARQHGRRWWFGNSDCIPANPTKNKQALRLLDSEY